MKSKIVVILLGACMAIKASAGVGLKQFQYSGYMRAGVGLNTKGGDQECFNNSGASANEFRLGNECSIYGETGFTAYHLGAPDKDGPFFKSQMRFAFFPPGHSSFEDNDSDGRDINIFEAYVEGGGLSDIPFNFWVGKRIYRESDVYMYDWYYFDNMNGNGAGISNVKLPNGVLSAAFLIQVNSISTEVGALNAQVLDLRVNDIKLTEKNSLNLWTALGKAPGGTASDHKVYQATSGWLLGARLRRNMPKGFNDLTLIYGKSLLESMSLYGDSAVEKGVDTQPDASRWRLVEHLAFTPSSRWAFHLASAYELRHTGASNRGKETWKSIGFRPVIFFTEHLHLALEAGLSEVNIEAERNADDSGVGPRRLARITIAPEISTGRDIWKRPVLRFFYSKSFWNEANKTKVGAGAPSYVNDLSGGAYGFQTEVWF